MNKKVLAVAVSSALAAPMAAHAVKYKLSGQINRAAVWQDDGQNSDIQFTDNISSGTRWRMVGSEDIGNGMKVGFNWEWQNSQNASGAPIKSGDFGESETLRKAEVWFSGNWGKVSLGQGDGAGNGATEVDLSNTWNVAYVSMASYGGAVAWRTGAGGYITSGGGTTSVASNGVTHGQTYRYYDSFSRYDRIRYDSPALGPVTISVSGAARDRYEGAVRWSQGLGGGQISAALFYGTDSGSNIKSRYGGSVAYLFSFGTNLMFSYSANDPDTPGSETGQNWYIKVGHNWGNNSASLGYGSSEDGIAQFTDNGFNIGFNHNIPKAKVDLYAGAGWYSLEDQPTGQPGVDDIWTVTIGTKLQFD